MRQDELTDEQRKIVDKVEKLLRLAGANTNEAEAASATARAMDLLVEYNIQMSSVDETGEGGGKRAEEKLVGGFYEFERDLWRYVADLNFCMCWHQKTWVRRTVFDAKADRILNEWRRNNILRGQFRIVGRVVNIQSTQNMTSYILQTVERLTRERVAERLGDGEKLNSQLRGRWAVSYREGIVARIIEKIWKRREEMLSEERNAAMEAEARAREAGMKGASTATGVTLASVRKSEAEANADFLYGEGWSAKQAADRARRAAAAAEADRLYTAWAAANPEQAAKEEKQRRDKERSRSSRSYRGTAEKERDWSAYKAGYAKGDEVGIDPQADTRRSAGGLGHTAGALGHG